MPYQRPHQRRRYSVGCTRRRAPAPSQNELECECERDSGAPVLPNRIVIAGTVIADPELHDTTSGTSLCSLRVVTYTRANHWESGEREARCNFFNVLIWGAKGENAILRLTNGDLVALAGRLESCRYETTGGNVRELVEIVADRVAVKHDGQFEEIDDRLTS